MANKLYTPKQKSILIKRRYQNLATPPNISSHDQSRKTPHNQGETRETHQGMTETLQ